MEQIHPQAIFIQLHTFCNAYCINCPHDFTYKTIHPKGRMNDKTWDKIISDLIQMDYRGQVGFYLHHEPLIATDLFEKITDVNKKTNAFVVISTNGALLTESNIEKLMSSRPSKVHININSGDKLEYENSMKLNYEETIQNTQNFITKAKDIIDIEINCPVMEGFNVNKLNELFPDVTVNLDYAANSRGGLLLDLYTNQKKSRFNNNSFCEQPIQNFNILYDGSVIVCCMDWMHESIKDFRNIHQASIMEIYTDVKKINYKFERGDYSSYKMCKNCSQEMGFNIKKSKLKVLLTNHHLLDFTGSEVYTLTLAKYLKANDCDVVVYSRYIDKIGKEFKELDIPVVNHLEEIKNIKFDIAHVHHNVNAAEVRYFYPNLPIVFLSHGILPFLEQPSVFELDISHYLAVSEEVKQNLVKREIDENKITVIGNIIDTAKFFAKNQINPKPQKVLVISAKINDEKVQIIKQVCDRIGLEYRFVGGRFGEVEQDQIFGLISEADIVFSLGRGVIEALLCKRAVIVFDSNGGDGMVTPENFDEIRKHNFSGRRFNKDYSVDDLIEEIKKYNPLNIALLYQKVFNLYSAANVVPNLINIYRKLIKEDFLDSKKTNSKTLEYFYNSLQETKNYTTILTQREVIHLKDFKNNAITREQIDHKTDLKINQLLSRVGFYNQRKENQFCDTPVYDILIPIYNAYDHVKTCVESVITNTDLKHKIYLLDDASPDNRILPLLNDFAEKDKRVVILSSEKNLGFIGNMNRGFALSHNDVIILNSDTQVTPLWIERMHKCVSSSLTAGIVSPLSNNATILSVPEMNFSNKLPEGLNINDFADLIAQTSNKSYPEIPTAVGFCMLIKRKVLDEVGLFDPIYGLGYGEENDLCERAKQKGYKLLCCDDAYVHHFGEASFSFVEKIDEKKINNQKIFNKRWPNYQKEVFAFCRLNPLREIQERIYLALNSKGKKHILHVMHNFNAAGGTELHTRNIIDGLATEFDSTVVYPATLGFTYTDAKSKKVADHLREVKFAKENNLAVEHFGGLPADLYSNVIEENFIRFLKGGNYDIIHFQHLSGWSTLQLPIIAKRMGKKVILSIHDFYLLCPELNLIYSYTNQRCGKNISDPNDKSCLYCLGTKRYNRYPEKAAALEDYILERNFLIKKIIESTDLFIVPSNFVKEKFQSAFDKFIQGKIYTVPHGISNLEKVTAPQVSKKLRVGFLGNASDRKGIYVFLDAVRKLQSQDFEFEVFGVISPELKYKCNELKINTHGGYKSNQLSRLLKNIDLVLIASIVDETFSLTLSETMLVGVPVLSSDAGALKERIEDGKTGFLFTSGDSSSLMEKLIFIKKNPKRLKDVRKVLEKINVKSMEENIEDYRKIYLEIISKKKLDNNLFKSIEGFPSVPSASVIVLTYNALEFTKKFYESLNQFSGSNYELIVIDNASTDGTKQYLESVSTDNQNANIIFNETNLGFPIAINQGIQVAKGKYILIANNDILVTKGWLERLVEVAESDPKIGIVGPISNEVSGVQKDKDANYETIDEMYRYADIVKEKNKNKVIRFPRVAFLCTLIKREVIDRIGGLDERFTPGNFEDDDFCLRAQLAGYKTVIAQDVFIHHYGSKSFKADGEKKYIERLKANQEIFVKKWGADPDEIWIKQKSFNQKRTLFISINNDEVVKHFERAQNKIQDKEYDLALNDLELALEKFDLSEKASSMISKEDLYILTANISLILKDPEKAKLYFEESLKLNPTSSEACFGLGQVFYQLEMFEESKTMLEWAVKNDPDNQTVVEALKSVNQMLDFPENHNSLFENQEVKVEVEN